jgi:hypothetical protein
MATTSPANQGWLFQSGFSPSSSWFFLSSISSDSKSNSSYSEKLFGSEMLPTVVSGIKSRGSWILVIEKSIKSSTE